MWHDPRSAYESATTATASSRELEADALFRAARRLESCQREWGAPGSPERLEAALKHNQSLWTFLQAELLEPNHAVPADLRAQLLAISRFVDRRTFEMMGAPWADGLAPLIAVNRQIAAGLATSQAPGHGGR
jgi:flagellar biosynthesis activator protein FlaF